MTNSRITAHVLLTRSMLRYLFGSISESVQRALPKICASKVMQRAGSWRAPFIQLIPHEELTLDPRIFDTRSAETMFVGDLECLYPPCKSLPYTFSRRVSIGLYPEDRGKLCERLNSCKGLFSLSFTITTVTCHESF